MSKPLLSVVIPSHSDRDGYLYKTIGSLLENAVSDIEIITVLDGYRPDQKRVDSLITRVEGLGFSHDRVLYLRHPTNRGMREAINTGVQAAQGKYIMRTDEHCMFAPGFDAILTKDLQEDWIMVPRRYKLDPVAWRRMDELGYIDYEKLMIVDKGSYRKFGGVEWRNRAKARRDVMIDETMAMQGSCWIMHKAWWDTVIGRLQSEGYGPLYQDSTEMAFKTWAAGGKLMVNKNTWYAHKHRDFNRTHHYPLERAIPEWQYALNRHRKEYEHMRKVFGI